MASVRLDNLSKNFGSVRAVDGVSLEIPDGELMVLVGPSGCGKSTLLRLVAGLDEPTSGGIFLDNRDVSRVKPQDRDVAMVFQNYALFPHLNVEQNMAFSLKFRKVAKPKIRSRVAEAAEVLGLADLLCRKPAELSGGQRQRVAIGRAIVRDPKAFLFDEPLSNLDAALRTQLRLELKRLHRTLGTTMVYVTHDQGEALTMSDRIAVFNEGLIQQLAPPSEVYEQPDNAFVAQFIGENNRLMGTVESIRDDQCSVRIEGGQQIVQARAVNNGPAGSRTTLSLRPESVKINPEGSGYSERFEARVEELIYLGDHTRVRVSVLQHDDFIIKVPRTDDAPVLQVGHTCTVAWQAKDCRALDATQD